MHPIGKFTLAMQSLREGEMDVAVLVLAARSSPEPYRPIVMKYVAVAVHALVDATSKLAGDFMRASRRNPMFAEAIPSIKPAKERFDRLRSGSSTSIAPRLNAHVRNMIAAHRHPQTVESVGRAHETLTSAEFPALFHATRDLIDALAAVPVWTYADWRRDGGVTVYRGFDAAVWEECLPVGADGFEVRTPAPVRVTPDAEEIDLPSHAEGIAWSEKGWL